uniref:Smoothelin domain-containing protein n=1 Tax=Lutzomyia longipalpis TaxID=7200 RepID=A0A1B0CDJ3_LUTLO
MDATTIGMGKGPLGSSHGDSLVDQSFQSLKSKEIRDSESPTRDYKFDVVAPDTSGWNVVTSSEVTNDGKTHTTQSLATTAGVQDVPGGKTSFSGRNEQLSSVTREGDDNNYTTSAGQSSNTLLQETTVTGDETSGRTESKSTSVTSSSRVIKSQHTSSGDQAIRDHRNIADEFDELLQSTRNTSSTQSRSNVQQQSTTSLTTSASDHQNEQLSGQESKISTTTTKQHSTTDKTAESHQREVERLAALPGEIISRKIDYPDANTKMITETKALDDGTIVTTTKYETRSASSKVWSSASNKQECTSSRSITEERAQKQRIECIRDDTANVRDNDHQSIHSHDLQSNDVQKKHQEIATKSRETTEKLRETSHHDHETSQQQTFKTDVTIADDYAPSEASQFSPQSNKTFEYFNVDSSESHHEDVVIKKQDYRQDHISKRVSVEVDAAHDAFARSLRSISPDRGSTKSSRTTLDKIHSRRSPSRDSDISRISSNTVTKSKSDLTTHDYKKSTISSERRQVRGSTPTVTTKRPSALVETTEVETVESVKKSSESKDRVPVREPSPVRRPTQASKKPAERDSRSPTKQPLKDFETDSARSTSPTSTVSDIVYHHGETRKVITDLDTEETTKNVEVQEVKKTTEEFINTESTTQNTTTEVKQVVAEGYGDEVVQDVPQVTEKPAKTPTAQPRKSSLKKTTEDVTEIEKTSEETTVQKSKRHQLTRSETYEERCRQILGMSDKAEIQAKGEENLTNILTAIETQEKTSQAKDTVDFLANEINVENANKVSKSPERKPKTPSESPRKISSPSKKTPTSSPERKPSIKVTETVEIKTTTKDLPKDSKPQDRSPERKPSDNHCDKGSAKDAKVQDKSPERKPSVVIVATVIKKELKEDDKERKSTTTIVTTKEAPEKKTLGERKKSTGLDKSPDRKQSVKSTDSKHVTTAKITISPVASKTKPKDEKPTTKKPKKITHSDYSSEAEDSEKENPQVEQEVTRTTEKITRRINKLPVVERKESATSLHENTFRSSTRKRSKPEVEVTASKTPEKPTKVDSKRPTKCITTKTINLTATNHIETKTSEDVDVIVDIQQAKSSREPSPNRIIPVPVSPEEDTGKPRYPDDIHEPDDERRQPKIKNIPIFEEETSDYIGCSITEVAEDDTTMSVTEKVNLFSSIKETSNYDKTSTFVKESSVEIDDKLRNDECLLSVSDKVNKFITTAEEVKKIRTSTPFSPEREKDDSIRVDEECLLSVTDKVTKFISTAEEIKKPKVSAPFVPETRTENGDLVNDESQLTVTEKVTKFRTRAEKLSESTPQRSPELVAKIDRQKSTVPSSPITLRSTEIVKKAKAVFEKNKTPDSKPRDILSRPSVWEGKKSTKLSDIGVKEKKVPEKPTAEEVPKSEGFFLTEPHNRDTPRELDRAFQNSNDSIPSYLKDAVATRKNIFEKKISSSRLETEKIRRKSQENVERKLSKTTDDIEPVVEEVCVKKVAYQTPAYPAEPANQSEASPRDSVGAKRSIFERKDSLPSYMSHTVSSLEHMTGTRKDSIEINKSNLRKASVEKKEEEVYDGNPRSTVKFGVALKRTDSETSQPRRKSSCSEIPHIEEIFDLELLERMLETVTGYEQRRRIRAQIRLVKKQMESKSEITSVRKISPTRKLSPRKISGKPAEAPEHTQLNGHKSESETIEIYEKHISRSPSPPKSLPNLRQMRPIIPEQKDEKPIWATKNILKKASETNRTYTSRRVVSDTKSQRTRTVDTMSEPKSIDCVTSSYGIGPTDDNGQPLFGLRALKKKNTSSSDTTTKVSGSIIRESYHSMNGSEPVGQRSVTLYSSDPTDFDQFVVRRGSVKELSEKFIQKEAAIVDKSTTQSYPKAGLILRTQTSREDRRDDRRDSDTKPVKSEKQQGRVVVTKTQTISGDGGGYKTTTTTTSKETRSFLNSANSKVTDVQDVLDRMRNADNVEEAEDSVEDREARALLNKFIGASVLMAGMESMMPQEMNKIVGQPMKQQDTRF